MANEQRRGSPSGTVFRASEHRTPGDCDLSGIALIWAANVKGLKPSAKVVLIQLADFHNKETGRCNPSAQRLADDCEMNRATVFRHLIDLEKRGLITRHNRGDGTGGRGSNQYELHLDVVLGPSSEHKEKSQIATRGVVAKCDGGSRTGATGVVANCDTNLLKEPGSKNPPNPPRGERRENGFERSKRVLGEIENEI